MGTRVEGHTKRCVGALLLLFILNFRANAADEKPLVFLHATVIDGTGAPAQTNVTVAIQGDRIVAIGREVPLPDKAQVVDATGKFLIPGLWDMHVHWEDKDFLPLFIANGVTGARIMWGMPMHREWRKEIEHGTLVGPRLLIASAIIDGPNPIWPGSEVASNAVEGRQAVIRARNEGADFVKVYSRLPRDAYFAIADEAKKQGIPFEGHVPDLVSVEEASVAGQKSIEHLTGVLSGCSVGGAYNPARAETVFAEFRVNQTWQCPTFTVLRLSAADSSIVTDDRVKYMPSAIKSYWNSFSNRFTNRTPEDLASRKKTFEKELELVGAMQRAGVGILAGTDTGNPYCFAGFSLHDELGWLVQAGLTPMEAIQAATRNAAHFMGRESDLGTVRPGKLADLVLLDANPLDDISNTRKIGAVVYGGRYFPRSALDDMLAKVENYAGKKTVTDMLFEVYTKKGVDAAIKQYRELKSGHSGTTSTSEEDLNNLGYELIAMKRNRDAIEILELNREAYPQSANVYDSLGEAYMIDGDKKDAIESYEKSVKLDPNNRNAIEKLKQLKTE